ncbi:hypothetical protein IU471_10565 [Nocardia elegans]|uniref:linalool dehydratase/isomerase domain-containing protein n=1 Tax=Nocardia elegans TaxID=300029 RepID=UPI001894C135|nr:hypothetical protein [Nocardia elegans]MBF6244025.1 hypothetical protein [Nocardia elegans]
MTGTLKAYEVGEPAATRPVAVPPLDEEAPLIAPVARRTMLRVAGICAATWSVGGLLMLSGSGRLAVLGAALMFPGGGHFAADHVVHGMLAVSALLVGVLMWWMIGAFLAPITVWVLDLAFVLAAGHHHPTGQGLLAVASAGPMLGGLCLTGHALRHRRRRDVAARLNAELCSVELRASVVPSRSVLPVGEATPADLEHLRFALDLALQPLSSFDGFDRRDQFREAALRYQLCILGYALSTYRYNYAPALAGYLTEAQSRAILKMGDRRVWGYWALENAWGRLSLRRDPVDNGDNVMLTGWQGVAVGMFETLADSRFSAAGALTYRWSDNEQYAYDFPSLVASIERNIERSRFTFFSCEPRWIYPVCNSFAVNTLLMDRRLSGGTGFDRLEEQLRRTFVEEFHRPDGRVIGVRSETLGLSWSPWAGDGVWLPTTYWTHAAFPDLAHRSWWLLKEKVLQRRDDHFTLPPTSANRCDSGSYIFGKETFGQLLLAMAAREMGDEEVAAGVLRHVDQTEEVERRDGAARYAGLSTQGNLYGLMARFGRSSGLRDLIGFGVPETWRDGPRLAEAAYPEVLVARAVTDGAALSCVLYPGTGATRTRLAIDQLRPRHTYNVHGAAESEVVADDQGRATLTVDLEARLSVDVEPAS